MSQISSGKTGITLATRSAASGTALEGSTRPSSSTRCNPSGMTCHGTKALRPVDSACPKRRYSLHTQTAGPSPNNTTSAPPGYTIRDPNTAAGPMAGRRATLSAFGLYGLSNAETRTPLASLLDTISRRLPPELQQIILTLLQRSAMDGTHVGPMGSGQDEPAVESGGTLFTQLAVVQSQKVPVLKQIRTGMA